MIELELKYCLDEMPPNLKNLEFVGSKFQSDVYFDTKDYDLLKNGNFLRVRNGKTLDFKIDVNDNSHLVCKETSFAVDILSSYLPEINNVFNMVGIPESSEFVDFQQFLAVNKLQVIAHIHKKRSDFMFGDNYTISVDEVADLGWFLEAEIIIDSDNILLAEANKIKRNLVEQLVASGILTTKSNEINVGYVELYLLKHNKYAYDLGKFKK